MNNIATIKILNEIQVVIIGLKITEYKQLYDMFGMYDNGYIFKPAYSLGRWDGKIRLVTKNGVTSIHLLPKIIPFLEHLGYGIKLIDTRPPITFDVPDIQTDTFLEANGITLAEHQVLAVNGLLENRGGIGLAGTGAGKSFIIGALFHQLHKYAKYRCIAIVPTADLVTQTAKEVKLFCEDIGMYYSKVKELKTQHLVTTWQSLQNNPEILGHYNAIIVDEAHGAKSNVLRNMITDYGCNAHFIAGVTGTLPKHEADLAQVNYVLGYTVSTIESSELIDMGWLAQLNLQTIMLKEDLTAHWEHYKVAYPEKAAEIATYKKFKSSYFPDYPSERNWVKTKHNRTEFLADMIMAKTEQFGNSFVLVNGIPFGKRLAKCIPNAIFISGTDDSAIRAEIYKLFTDNDNVTVIASFQLASTGLNIKRIFNLFMIDPNKSFIQIIQSIGRGLRKAEDKDTIHVWDIYSDFKYALKHARERKNYYKEKKYHYTEIAIEYESLMQEYYTDKSLDESGNLIVY